MLSVTYDETVSGSPAESLREDNLSVSYNQLSVPVGNQTMTTLFIRTVPCTNNADSNAPFGNS
jgi:hypothetical protein